MHGQSLFEHQRNSLGNCRIDLYRRTPQSFLDAMPQASQNRSFLTTDSECMHPQAMRGVVEVRTWMEYMGDRTRGGTAISVGYWESKPWSRLSIEQPGAAKTGAGFNACLNASRRKRKRSSLIRRPPSVPRSLIRRPLPAPPRLKRCQKKNCLEAVTAIPSRNPGRGSARDSST